ncbi:MAG: response regulator [Pseudomonadota bacterium]
MQELPIKVAMLIDDESVDQMLYQRVMKHSGVVGDVFTFNYADEALVFLKSEACPAIDVIFLDINMPRMNGFEFLEAAYEALGGNFARAVIIMLTTSLDSQDQDRVSQYSVVKDCIDKPLTAEHINNIAGMLSNSEPF